VKVTKFSTTALGQQKGLEQNFGPLGTNPAASSEITINAISQCFTKKFTTATYRIGIGRVRCLRKALVKFHSVSKIKKLKKINLTRYSLPRTPKTKIWFQGILGIKQKA
jgi:hypothetical protein